MGHLRQSGKQFVSLLLVLNLLGSCLAVAPAAAEPRLGRGQVVYVPVYSNIFSAPKKIPFNLATMLSIRNTTWRARSRLRLPITTTPMAGWYENTSPGR